MTEPGAKDRAAIAARALRRALDPDLAELDKLHAKGKVSKTGAAKLEKHRAKLVAKKAKAIGESNEQTETGTAG